VKKAFRGDLCIAEVHDANIYIYIYPCRIVAQCIFEDSGLGTTTSVL
jgi:hypothetical protein